MERIQTALAKARAARERKLEAVGQPSSAKSALSGHWLDLAKLSLDMGVLDSNRIIAHNSTPGSASFDVMRTNLLRTLRLNGWTRVAVTSPTAGCGKSTVTLNLAFSLARLADIKILVVELDLRHPSMVRILGARPGQNFAGMLKGARPDLSQIRRWGKNLAFAISSNAFESPAELLSASRTADMIDEIEAMLRPDVILFDMSPMLVNDDAIAFLDQVDCALMVAAAEETTATEVERCGKELAKRTQVLGVVLNKCRYLDRNAGRAYPE
ncbi:CpsD/CapB family tyrosine-protein kinase [Tabrizicola sp.]|uniref:CpsD/CapB family tyrosine-protein kinase n=1 Tax=Tabrizicola sp. TaxID=2005166 RepID=UPI003F3E8342